MRSSDDNCGVSLEESKKLAAVRKQETDDYISRRAAEILKIEDPETQKAEGIALAIIAQSLWKDSSYQEASGDSKPVISESMKLQLATVRKQETDDYISRRAAEILKIEDPETQKAEGIALAIIAQSLWKDSSYQEASGADKEKKEQESPSLTNSDSDSE